MKYLVFGLLFEVDVSGALCVQTVHSHLIPRLRAAGEMPEPDLISDSLVLAGGTRESPAAHFAPWRLSRRTVGLRNQEIALATERC